MKKGGNTWVDGSHQKCPRDPQGLTTKDGPVYYTPYILKAQGGTILAHLHNKGKCLFLYKTQRPPFYGFSIYPDGPMTGYDTALEAMSALREYTE